MSCALCGTKTAWSGPVFGSPPSLAGKSACDPCDSLTDDLRTGRLAQSGFEQLAELASKLDNPRVAQEIQAGWESGVLLATQKTEAAAARSALVAMMVTSGFDFAGYRILSYFGFVSSEVVMGMGLFRGIGADFANFFGAESESLGTKMSEAKGAAFMRLRRQVQELGGNAIIGADLDYTMFGTSLVGVIASGTAVSIEPAD